MSHDVIISVKNLSKTFKLYNSPKHRLLEALHPLRKKYHTEYHALKDISFEIKKGESVGILGKNGAGKSTLLKILTGVLTPTSGEVKINGKIAALLELGAGFNPDLSGLENIYFQGAIMGFTRAEMQEKLQEIIDFADIGEFIHQPVKTYSSGMFARLAFSIAINVDPDILIVDEALAVGDVIFQKRCNLRMQQLLLRGVSILFVSHDEESMRVLTTKAILISTGSMILFDFTPEVINSYKRLQYEEEYKNELALLTKNRREIGNKDVEILRTQILDVNDQPVTEISSGELLKIKVECISHVDIDKLNVGLRIRNKEGFNIYSWGTYNQDMWNLKEQNNNENLLYKRNFKKNEIFFAEFIFRCILGANVYEIESHVTYEPSTSFSDRKILNWVEEAAFIKVTNKSSERIRWGGAVDLNMAARF